MSAHVQFLVVVVVVGAAVVYAAWRVFRALQAANDPCAGCEGCPLKDAKRKKNCKKFGRTK